MRHREKRYVLIDWKFCWFFLSLFLFKYQNAPQEIPCYSKAWKVASSQCCAKWWENAKTMDVLEWLKIYNAFLCGSFKRENCLQTVILSSECLLNCFHSHSNNNLEFPGNYIQTVDNGWIRQRKYFTMLQVAVFSKS